MSRPYFRNTPNWVGNYSFNQEKILTIDKFGGGMNNVDADTVIKDYEATNTQNMMFVSGSLMQKRFGTAYVDQTTYPDITKTIIIDGNPVAVDVPITWVDEYKPMNNVSAYIEGTNEAIYVGGVKICDVNGRVHGVNYLGKYYFVDGKYLYVYNGANYYRIIEAPTAKLTQVSANGSTTITIDKIPPTLVVGKPVYIIATNGTTLTNTVSAIDVANKKITLGTAITTDLAVNQLVMFFTPNATTFVVGNEVWDATNHYAYYEPCLNEIKDTYAGLSFIPNSPNVITVHKDRIFVSGDTDQPHSVYMSFTTQPLYYPVNAGVGVKPNGEKVVDLIVFDNALIIGRHNDMYVLYGSTEVATQDDYFKMQQMDVSMGFMCTDCGAMLNNFYIYMGYDGRFYRLNSPSTYVDYLMAKPLDWKIDIYKEPFNITKSEELKLSTVAYSNEIYFTVNSEFVLVYNFDNQAWTYYTGSKSVSIYTDGLTMIIGRSDGKLVKVVTDGTVWNDLDKPIYAKYITKRFDLQQSVNYKYFKQFMITTEAYDGLISNIDIYTEIDLFYRRDSGCTIPSNKSLFGYAKFGDIFNNQNLNKSRWIYLDAKGRTIKFTLENNNSNEPFRIYDINVLYSNRDVR